jgi:co-chaperonin GroES (HSP10)
MQAQDVTPDVHAIMTAPPSHDEVAIPIAKIRPLRGRVFVEVLDQVQPGLIIRPAMHSFATHNDHARTWHRGRVLALGLPAYVTTPGTPEVPWGVGVGDEVFFVLAVWLDKMRITRFVGVRGEVAVLAQCEVLASVDR